MKGRPLRTLAACLLVAGCATTPNGTASSPDPPVTGGSRAVELLNLWRVTDAPGEPADTWLRIDVAEFQLWRGCGMIHGSWAATDTLFLGSVTGASGECGTTDSMPTIDWLEEVAFYERIAGGWELLGDDGALVATLTIDGAPEPIATAADFYAEPPVVTDDAREALRPPAALPDTLEPAAAAFLHGRWVPMNGASPTDPHVAFDAEGGWSGSDGCNGGGGRWAVDDDGRLPTTSGPSTMIGCEGAPVPTWVATAQRAAIDGDLLVLVAQDGADIARLTRG